MNAVHLEPQNKNTLWFMQFIKENDMHIIMTHYV